MAKILELVATEEGIVPDVTLPMHRVTIIYHDDETAEYIDEDRIKLFFENEISKNLPEGASVEVKNLQNYLEENQNYNLGLALTNIRDGFGLTLRNIRDGLMILQQNLSNITNESTKQLDAMFGKIPKKE